MFALRLIITLVVSILLDDTLTLLQVVLVKVHLVLHHTGLALRQATLLPDGGLVVLLDYW